MLLSLFNYDPNLFPFNDTLEILNVVYLLIMKWNLSIVAVGTFEVVLADQDLDC